LTSPLYTYLYFLQGPGISCHIYLYICDMKKINPIAWGVITLLVVLSVFIVYITIVKSNKDIPAEIPASSETQVQIYNYSKDTIKGYLTLGTTEGCLQNVLCVPFIIDTVTSQGLLQGFFILAPGDSTDSYSPDSLGFNGVISFAYPPDNCPTPSYTNGLNQFEFIINNSYQPGNPQETIDISCVHGTNCVIRVDLISSNLWNAGPSYTNIQSFSNTMNKSQVGTPGVYPYGCDTCTASKSPPTCIPLPQPAQKSKICNVQRNASQSGGLIKIVYLGDIDILK